MMSCIFGPVRAVNGDCRGYQATKQALKDETHMLTVETDNLLSIAGSGKLFTNNPASVLIRWTRLLFIIFNT